MPAGISKLPSLSSSFRRKQYYKERFEVVEPVEYILEATEKRSYQHIPILQSLVQVLDTEHVREKVLNQDQGLSSSAKYESSRDGTVYKDNSFYSEELRTTLVLYVDDFEICNPLGMSRKKHKITAVYWIFGNIPHTSQSTLNSVNLAMLCKAVDIKRFGYATVLAPLLKSLAILEKDGILHFHSWTKCERVCFWCCC